MELPLWKLLLPSALLADRPLVNKSESSRRVPLKKQPHILVRLIYDHHFLTGLLQEALTWRLYAGEARP